MNTLFDMLAGAVCGVLSGFGLGGGSLLLIYMSHIASIQQTQAQGINLIYFIPTAVAALISHLRHKLVSFAIFLWASVPGTVASVLSAIAANSISPGILRKFFGIFLLVSGVKILFRKAPPSDRVQACKQ